MKSHQTNGISKRQIFNSEKSYVNFHIFNRESFYDGALCRHVAVELVSALVPLDAVESIAAQVVAACEVGLLALLDELRDPDRQV